MNSTRASMLSFLSVPIVENNHVRNQLAKGIRQTFELQWTAVLVRDVLPKADGLPMNELCRLAWQADNNIQNHLVISVFYAYLNRKVATADTAGIIHTLVSPAEITVFNDFFTIPDTAGVKMEALFLLACNPDGLTIGHLFQAVYDRCHDDMATRYAIWELISSNEITHDNENTLYRITHTPAPVFETMV